MDDHQFYWDSYKTKVETLNRQYRKGAITIEERYKALKDAVEELNKNLNKYWEEH